MQDEGYYASPNMSGGGTEIDFICNSPDYVK